ncbi:hypothetical protein A3C34_04060 [Candidatus Amesbacteria bacterium RIFCSPHIGHO2_02_FULL_48_21]|uniref:Uncharacterized protein n=2 Tax=Candidatus Amesiibacteriota TaxID=1752730 RepID=A0A0G1UGF0_9BACT|nr:MAG: hypothetical protein UY22_C0020G0013 [Candidatus Amesbacteria bacterium GW2011_GWC1_48_10]OGC91461.1 MAG: hypothetical protein A2V48_03385 [Candidatus Amesbacteria bacterium RBG_19FT_COMBO_48_16]OGC96057.1 MAG: hypothetical protein A3C34_04060 [Candidatus Amesbacteria bacterium RIFCSPHIGHO2_02_FULL_48_21]OGD11031.1 MAG: hypothetical protein A2576_00295 [Candidatus Amesbacteria bacterium RIFOXYD1_FULL_47_9]
MSHNPEIPLESFEQAYAAGLDQLPELIESEIFDTPLPLDPDSLNVEPRTFEELSPLELDIVQKTIFNKLGLTSDPDTHKIREYTTPTPPKATVPGTIKAVVYSTNIEGVFLQELVFPDFRQSWVIGPDQNI